ncbi:hypothetical protein [Algisphaera agarilytica]|uniref:Uncharacterized protein n=1 Tax=Algisphaera agarilytica TaxID=1385975 RepID=A0A7X0H3P0_9BACT|nr:hypothetical protein [Algisphaera agarilytica]MBB6428614.1 hypothetical protein [Algisphaera agarilytica]
MKKASPTIELRSERIVMTIELLIERIDYRLPGRGLGNTARLLRSLAGEAVSKSVDVQKPNMTLRVINAVIVSAMLGVLMKIGLSYLHALRFSDTYEPFSVLEGIDAAISTVVYLGLLILFVFSVETRLKRRKVLAAVQEMRALAHVIDMHQFSKDPERLVHEELIVIDPTNPDAKPQVDQLTPFLMGRYLDYCSEMLSLIGKVAALYAQNTQDAVVLAAVDEIETLTTGLSGKI